MKKHIVTVLLPVTVRTGELIHLCTPNSVAIDMNY